MDKQKFVRGDVVKLKTGGVEMMVEGYQGSADNLIQELMGEELTENPYTLLVECSWNLKGKGHYATYHQDLLELVRH